MARRQQQVKELLHGDKLQQHYQKGTIREQKVPFEKERK